MSKPLLELSTKELLEKFGAGSHKPGSGSAAALQGMLSAELILTVIDLTFDPKRRDKYIAIIPQLKEIDSETRERIFPRLQELFQQDSDQFVEVIELRKARDAEKSYARQRALDQKAQDALKPATDTLVEIASLCVELCDFAIMIFNNAFRSARGDSGMADFGALAVVGGCLSIINLNLLSVNDDEEWIEQTKASVTQLKSEYERLDAASKNCITILENEVLIHESFQSEIKTLQSNRSNNPGVSDLDLEELARKVHLTLWKYKGKLWRKNIDDPLQILRPSIAIEKLMEYKVVERDSLADFNFLGTLAEVAGIIDNQNKAIGISKKFPSNVQNFTLAHELGHTLLHQQTGLHRDRPLEGNGSTIARDSVEIQADKFASYFLMPGKQILRIFRQIFNMEKFSIDEDSVFALTGEKITSFRERCNSQRDLARIIASAESLYGAPFRSLSSVFNVSVEAMAIRLEELKLVEFEPALTGALPSRMRKTG